MVKKAILIKTPTGYESECTHCGTTNFSTDATGQMVCKMCNKEYLATVAHTEEGLKSTRMMIHRKYDDCIACIQCISCESTCHVVFTQGRRNFIFPSSDQYIIADLISLESCGEDALVTIRYVRMQAILSDNIKPMAYIICRNPHEP